MKKEIVTLGSISNITIKLGNQLLNELNENNKVIIELRLIFESRNDKIYNLVKDYIHLLNSIECDSIKNNTNNCKLCESIIQECEFKTGIKKTTILLAQSQELIIEDSKLIWDINQELKHYKLIGIFSNSTITNFLFPLTTLQYNNSKMFLSIVSINNFKTIWNSNTFLMNNFIKFSYKIDYEKQDETQIYVNTKNNNSKYIYTESKIRIINNDKINQDIKEKYKVQDIIKKSIELHSILKSCRNNLEKLQNLKNKCNKRFIQKNNNFNYNLFYENNKNYIENNKEIFKKDSFKSTNISNNIKNDEIINEIKNLHSNHKLLENNLIEIKKDIKEKKIKMIKLKKIINLYRNNLFDIVSYCIYPITMENKTGEFNICNLPLPIINVIQNLDNKQQPEISTSLGYSLHYIKIISNILRIPLSSKIFVQGSFSTINNYPLYIYPNINKDQVKKALFYLKSVIFYQLLSYFNVSQNFIKKLLSSNNILLLIISIRNFIKNL